jgi:hypothetical protein
MHPVAHHAGEEALAPLLLLAGGGLSLAAAYVRAWFTDTRERLAGHRRRGAS